MTHVIRQLTSDVEKDAVILKSVPAGYCAYRGVDDFVVEAYCCDTKSELAFLVQDLEAKGGVVRVLTNTGENPIIMPAKPHPEFIWYTVVIIILFLILSLMRRC